MPSSAKDEAAAVRARFFIRAWVVGAALAALTFVISAALAAWPMAALMSVVLWVAPLALLVHRKGVAPALVVHGSLGFALLLLGLSSLASRPASAAPLALLILVPLASALLLGRGQSLPWALASMAWGGLVSLAGARGAAYPLEHPAPSLFQVSTLAIGLALGCLMLRTYEASHAAAMLRLQQLDRARSGFLATISHEIRTPMNGVLGMTEVLLLEQLAPLQREQLRIIQRSGRTLVALINDLLDVTKMEAGKLALEERDFNLDTVLADVQGLAAGNAASRGLSLRVNKGHGVPARLRGDGLRLGQVLTNLLSNAVKFTAQGEVRLDVTRVLGPGLVRLTFAVTDTGAGIAPEVLPRLFSAFEQGDSSTTRKYGGTGLGLALSQQLVGLMGGRIEVTSTPGKGSRFAFTVAFDDAEGPSAEYQPLLPLTAGGKRTVLVVDDNPVNLKVAISLVEKAGFKAEGAPNGRAALEALQKGSYALVLMDCHMPEMDGFEATERIRKLEGLRSRTPIVALTASAMPEELAACRRVGMNSVLAKPLTFAALRAMLAEQVA